MNRARQAGMAGGSGRSARRPPIAAGLALIGLWLAFWPAPRLLAATNAFTAADCFACHDDASLSRTNAGKAVSLYVPTNALAKSVHSGLSCTDCHAGIADLPHSKKLPAPQCGGCHDEVARQYGASIHGVSQSMGNSGAATCAGCHGSHDIIPVKLPDSPVFKLNLSRTCARCHSNDGLTKEYRMKYPDAVGQYAESIHGRALLQLGLVQAPSCNDCHGIHDIRRSVDREASINHANIAKTCGKCHAGVEQVYNQSVHGQLLAGGDKRGPVCTDCHTAHDIQTPNESHFKQISDERCGACHQDRLEHYRETYHGKAVALGAPNTATSVAACFDCHGYHDVLPPSNPRSRLSPAHIVQTCRHCHAGATARFAQYIPHANPLDSRHYPVLHVAFVLMTGLLIGVFGFFGLHTAFWLFRSWYLYHHDSKAYREAKVSTRQGDEWFTRFTPFERFLHFLVVTSFLLLVITGMPLKFYYTAWAKVIFGMLGGAQVARWLHHIAAVVTFIYFGLHLSERVASTWRNRSLYRDPETGRFSFRRVWARITGPDSMVPTIRDWREFIAHQKWFFGKGPRPDFDRWTYWERFDYLAVFWGVAMIGASGVIMWVPEFCARFMPGWVINIALIVHSDEALLAAGFIFTFHFFNVHFRLEKFPMDTVIFSGRISKAEMLHERKNWYDRLAAEGRLDDYRIKDEWARWKRIAQTFGYAFFGAGLVLLVLIIFAMSSRLTH